MVYIYLLKKRASDAIGEDIKIYYWGNDFMESVLYDIRIKRCSSFPVVCKMFVHVLFTLFVFVCI